MLKNCVVLSTRLHGLLLGPRLSRIAARHLYSLSALGVDNYVKSRDRVNLQFKDIADQFKQKMNEYANDEKQMIFTEDLKHIVHLVESTEEDLTLLEQMLVKFCKQNKEMRFGSFVFGPVVMRMYYHLNKYDEALKIFKNPEMSGFFDQLITFQILLDLLYKNQRYADVLSTFSFISEKQIQGSKYPKNGVVLTLAACYKMNTEESLNYAKKLWSSLNELGHYPMRKAATFFAALAILQNAPDIALEVLTSVRQPHYVTVRNLKIAALAALGRPEDCLPILRSVLESDTSHSDQKHTFAVEMVDKVSTAVNKANKADLTNEFERIEKQLKSLGYISSEPLDFLLCKEIDIPPMIQNREQMHSNRRDAYSRNQYQRPSLRSMV